MDDGPYRGAGISHVAHDGRLLCPRCGSELENTTPAHCTIGKCGEWWPEHTLADLIGLPELAPNDDLLATLPAIAAHLRKLQLGHEPPPAACPVCRELMDTTIRARVVIDGCRDHGVWLDRGERELLERTFRILQP